MPLRMPIGPPPDRPATFYREERWRRRISSHSEAPGSAAWDVVRVEQTEGGWAYHSSTHGAVPEPTLAQRGAGLRLVWPENEIVRNQGDFRNLRVLLRNDRPDAWDDDRGEYQPIAAVIDLASGAALGDGYVYVIGVGRSYHLEPGASVALNVLFDLGVERTLLPGRYGIVAQLGALGLRSDQAVSHHLGGRQSQSAAATLE